MAATEVMAIANFSGETGELSFKKGDTIRVLEKVDENWSKGKIGTMVGIFPVNFVTTKRNRPTLPANVSNSPRSSRTTNSPRHSRVSDSARQSRPRSATTASKTSGRGYSPRTNPARTITSRASGSRNNSPSLNGVDRKVQPCARAIFAFTGEKKDELSFSEGVKIRLLKRIDSNWLEGELNGKIGIFPQSFVKIEVGLPSKGVESVLADSGRPYARAICDFHDDAEGDIEFERGDLIELLSWAGEGWLKGQTSNGMIGVFPLSFVHVIKPLPVTDNPPSLLVLSPSPTNLVMTPQPKPRTLSVSSNVPKPVPRRRVSPGVPKRSAPCPPGWQSPKQPHERTRPKTPDFELSHPMKRNKHRTLTVARSVYGIDHHGNTSMVKPTPRKRIHSVVTGTPVNHAQLSMQIEELQSKLTLEQKMLHSAEALMKVATTPDKQVKLDNSITEHRAKVASLEQQLEELMAEHKEQSNSGSSRSGHTMPRPPSPPREDPEVVKEIMRQKRLDELMETERIYLSDMLICYHDIMPAMSQISGLDISVLFGNIAEVVKVTEELLEELEANKMAIGKTFSKFSSRLCTIYGIYCRNNETAMTFLEKYLENPELSAKIQKCFNKAMPENDAHSWDLLSMIIKPVQRITKYPLLLGELLKVTDDTHPDWTQLQKAHQAMIGANSRINEFKRRKDLVEKYTGAEASITSRISLHSVRKKMTRVKQSITQRTGLRHKTVDAKFDEEEGHYMESDALVKGVYRMTLAWGDHLQESWRAHVNVAQGVMEAWGDEEHQSKSLVDSYHNIVNNAMQDKMKSHDHVIQPLQQLLTLFQGPSTLIGKRKDKLLDYDHLQHALEKTKDKEPDKLRQLTEQCTAAKRNYEALNTQLLEELPVFRVKVAKMVSRSVAVFLRAQNQLYLEWAELLQSLITSDEGVGLVEMHNILLQEACQQLTQLSVVPSWLGSNMIKSPIATTHLSTTHLSPTHLSPTHYSAVTLPVRGSVKSDDVTDSDRTTEKLPKVGELYIALYSFDAEDTAELTVAKGDTVVLVVPYDQLGSSEWWLVAKGNTEGYVPSVYLELAYEDETSHDLSQERSPEPRERLSKSQERSPDSQVRSPEPQVRSPVSQVGSPEPQMRSPDSQEQLPELQEAEAEHIYEAVDELHDEIGGGSHDEEEGGATYQVLFSFDANSDAELSVEEGELVWLLKSHDLTGNSEWWLVEKEGGAKGFVPATYLEINN